MCNEILYKIKRLRELQNLSQLQVSEKIGVERCTYNRIENGKSELTLTHFILIAGVLGLSAADLLSKSLIELIPICIN